MSQLDDYLAAPPARRRDRWSANRPSPWLVGGELVLATPTLVVGDPAFLADDAQLVAVDLVPGRYLVEYRLADFGRAFEMAGLGVRRADAELVRVSRAMLGRAPVDTGALALCERDAVRAAWDERASADRMHDAVGDVPFGTVALDEAGRACIPWIRAGFGDGEYPVRSLLDGAGARVGVRVECILAGARHPMADRARQDEEAFDPGRDLEAAVTEAQARIRERGGSAADVAAVRVGVPAMLARRPYDLHSAVEALVEEFLARRQ